MSPTASIACSAMSRFVEWADEWLASATVKANSKRVYGQTLEQAKRAFGRTKLRDLDTGDVRRFLEAIREEYVRRQRGPKPGEQPREVSPATLAKHLRPARRVLAGRGRRAVRDRQPGPAARTKLRRRAS